MISPSIFEDEIAQLRAKNLYRELRVLETAEPPYAFWQGKKVTLFCGNDYLGLSRHPRVVAAAKKALEDYGAGAGASRLISGTSKLHHRLEENLARLKNKEAALVFSSGYLANIGVLSALAGGRKTSFVMDKLCHASLIDGARLSGAVIRTFPHKNYQRCREIMSKVPAGENKILVSETIFSMDGDLADIAELIRIKERFGALLVLDDAHGTGIFGKGGGGLTEESGAAENVDLIIGTLSKALGGIGGFVAASGKMIEFLLNRARSFIFATALPPASCAAASEAIQTLQEEPQIRHRLWSNIANLYKAFSDLGFSFDRAPSPILPLIFGEEKKAVEVSAGLLEDGFFIPAIRYPTVPKGKARLRVTASSLHSKDDLEALLAMLKKFV